MSAQVRGGEPTRARRSAGVTADHREGVRDDLRDDLLQSLEGQVGVLVRRARRVIALRAAMVHPDLVGTSYLVLSLVAERGPLRAKQVADHFDLDKGAVSRQVQVLVDLGLLERSPDPADRRASILTATADAVERLGVTRARRRGRLRERLGEWNDDDLTRFVADLGRYNAALDWIDDAEMPNGFA